MAKNATQHNFPGAKNLFYGLQDLWVPNNDIFYLMKFQIQCDHLQLCQQFLVTTCDKIKLL